MYGKKQRIISFLMAFLLIFTFAFINPLTVQKAEAFAFAPVLTQGMARIITGVLVSAGFVIHEGATATADYDIALQNMSRVIYQTLDNAQKLLLGALSIVDNIVEVPVSLYNSIVNNANSVLRTDTTTTLSEQGISIRYADFIPTNSSYPKITTPFYYDSSTYITSGTYTERQIDLREAQPFFVYKGVENATENIIYEEGIDYYFLNSFGDLETATTTDVSNAIFLTPDISSYSIKNGSNINYIYNYIINETSQAKLRFGTYDYSNAFKSDGVWSINLTNYNVNDLNLYTYFVFYKNGLFTVTDIYNKVTGEFFNQVINFVLTNLGLGNYLYLNIDNTIPYNYDVTFEPDITTEIVPPVTNTAGDNVITLPNTLADTIGATSTDVNVSTGTGEGSGTNTETMENINTNVGELVTGGILGEQVNTNIGTVEGLHGEITGQVNFGAVFDTIAQYISALDISSVVWFSTAVASFLVPFLPLISLGLILFFIDRVLNGGA